MYSKIRKYLNQQIEEVFKGAKEHKDVFNADNIPSTKFDRSYHVIFDVPSISRGQQSLNSAASATVTLFFEAQRDVQSIYDEALDIASDVSRNCGSLKSLAQFRETDNYPLQDCNCNSITALELDTNDNSFKIILSFDLLINETIC